MSVGVDMLWLPVSGAAVAGGAVLAHGLFRPASRVFGPVICRGGPDAGARVALTFDDGPWPGTTERVLDTLAAHGARATFFVIGRYARAHPELLRRIAAEGHQIGNHTFDHDRLGLLRLWGYWEEQLRRTDDVIAEIVGERPRVFRPPMGFKSPPLARAARRLGHTVVAWSQRARDGVTTTEPEIVRALSRTGPGDIVLLHDGRDPASGRDPAVTAAALPRVLEGMGGAGLSFCTLDELISPPRGRASSPPAVGPRPASPR